VSFVCCQVEVSASARSLVQRSPTECSLSEYDRESSIMRKPWSSRAVAPLLKKKSYLTLEGKMYSFVSFRQ